jgi:hypothetical protein
MDASKAGIFYLLIVAIVDSPKRASVFVNTVGWSIFFVGLLMVLHQHEMLFGGTDVADRVGGRRTAALGEENFDPNDTGSLLVLGTIVFLANAFDASSLVLRLAWLLPTAIMVYGLQLTNSRAGFLALVVGAVAFIWVRWGSRGLMWGVLLLPLLVAIVATDRMTDVNAIHEGTGQSRLQLWSMGLSVFFRNPVLGVGPGEYVNHVGKACHNSFVQAYAELGFFGGTFFVAALYLGAKMTFRHARMFVNGDIGASQADKVIFVVPASIAAYITSLLTLNHLFACHTYLVLAMATVVTSVYGPSDAQPDNIRTMRAGSLITEIAIVSCTFIILVFVVCRVLVHW